MLASGYKISRNTIGLDLIRECRSVLPSILLNPKYIALGLTFHDLLKNKPDRFPASEPNKIDKNDLFIVGNPCEDYIAIKNLMVCDELWNFASCCLDQPGDNIAFSFMNITRKIAKYGPSIH